MTHPSVHARAHPDKVAYRMAGSGATLTYGELDRRSNQGAQLFRSCGLKPGDHVALLLENGLPFLEIAWAAQRSGLFYTAISRHLTAGEIAYILGDCGARLFVTSPACAETITALAGAPPEDVRLFMTGRAAAGFESWDAAMAAQPERPVADEVAGYDMLYSSGTTGRPKGVKPVFKNEPITALSPLLRLLCGTMCGMGEDSVYLSPAPLYHAAPLRFNMMSAALGGTSIVIERFDPEEYLRLLELHRATHTQLVPTHFVRMLKLPDERRLRYDVSSLKSAVHAAAPCPADVKARMIAWWGPILIEYYGGTETNGITIANSAEWLAHRGTVGRSLVGSVRITDEEDRELPPCEIGDVYFAGGPPFQYHNDPEKTKGAFNRHGWSTLGDIGYLDADGFLYLTDRRAYTIISGGVNVYPQEAEDVLIGHPAVSDVAVFGIPDEEMGEAVKAIVQPREMGEAGPVLEAELIAFCRARLAALKCPRSIDFESELPRTPTGKLIKRHLRDRYWPKAAGAASSTRVG